MSSNLLHLSDLPGSFFSQHRLADQLNRAWSSLSAEAILAEAIGTRFQGRIAVSSSFGAEAAVLLKLVARVDAATPVLFLDTGKLFAETLAYRDQLADHLGLRDVRTIRPDAELLAREDAAGLLYSLDPDDCCRLRKVEPLEHALGDFDAWITGRKRFQAATRQQLGVVEADEDRIKINPLATWDAKRILAAFDHWNLPRHPLEVHGFRSIGCAPCTRATKPGEDPRAGRWAGQAKTECGIHRSPGQSAACGGC